jgi:hypothetical protein
MDCISEVAPQPTLASVTPTALQQVIEDLSLEVVSLSAERDRL